MPDNANDEPTHFTLQGDTLCAALAGQLVLASIPFTVEPHPCDEWLFVTKREHRHVVLNQIEAATEVHEWAS